MPVVLSRVVRDNRNTIGPNLREQSFKTDSTINLNTNFLGDPVTSFLNCIRIRIGLGKIPN